MSNFSSQLAEARANLPLKRYMEQHHAGPGAGGNWKSFECFWCKNKSAGVFTSKGSGDELFKCLHVPCPTNNAPMDEIGFISQMLGLNREEAWKTYFKDAGVWKDAESHAPSIMPGFKARRKPAVDPSTENEALVQEAIGVIRAAGRVSVSLLQREMGLGYGRATGVITELERRKLVGPAGVNGARELFLPALPEAPSATENNLPSLTSPVRPSGPGEPASNPEESGLPAGEMVVPGVPAQAADAAATPAGSLPIPVPGVVPPSWPQAPAPVDPLELATETSQAVLALRRFYEQLELVPADVAKLWSKRGLSSDTVTALGYRSNLKSNKDILLALSKEFPPMVLLDSGLWSQGEKPTDPPKPNPQFYGMSLVEKRDPVTGKKVRDADGESMVECVWGDPGEILIPYFDVAGELVHLRPHKGMMKGRTPRLYVARPGKTWLAVQATLGLTPPAPKYAGITEGEFKAGAIWQVLGDEAAVAGLPGITLAKMLFGDVEEWLESFTGVRQVFVGYDNEDKSDPMLPGYQEDNWRRFDAQIWARFLATRLAKEGFEGKICTLPDEWRDAKGKADWDGQLAKMLDTEFARLKAAGKECGGMELWVKAKPAIRAAFTAVVRASILVREMWQARLFDNEEERLIKNGLERISFERSLPIGGDDEEAAARRLQRLVARLRRDDSIPPKARGFLSMLAKRYMKLKDRYYIFKKLSPKLEEQWLGNSEKASSQSDSDLKRACEIVLKGLPEAVSDFHLKAAYVLNKLNGKMVRLVTIHNVHGVKTKLVALESAPFAQPSKFREWLLDNCSGATWKAGERELNDLQEDIARDVAFKSVSEIAIRGYDADSKCWFFDDVVYAPDGGELFADKSGIIWLRGPGGTEAYKLSDKDHERENFCQRSPKMHPEMKIADEELTLLFQEISTAMNQTLGGSAGCLALGAVLAYGAGPEIYEQYNAFPGLWLHGETNQGKSSVARWLMKLWGFKIDGGMPLPDSTKVGISIAMQQYGNLPVWLEEFQPDAPKWMIEKIKNIYNRESGIKKTFDEGTRKILANAIITGIATCTDAQVKSRYAHLQVSAKNREINHYDWFEENSSKFYLLGRYILRNRKEFATKALAHMNQWLKSQEMATIDQRARIVHGASYGAFAALAEMLKSHQPNDLTKFRAFLLGHCGEAVQAVREKVNVNIFWRHLLDALSSDAFGETGLDLLTIFHLDSYTPAVSPVTPVQAEYGANDTRYAWTSYRLSFIPGPVIEKLMAHVRRIGATLPLERGDLRSQMQMRPYWVQPTSTKGHQQRFGKGVRSKTSCWTIDVDAHELGFQAATDAEFTESLYQPGKKDQGIFLPSEDWSDPRKGDMFQLVEMLIKAKAKRDE